MPRTLTAAALAALESDTIRAAWLVSIGFATETVNVWTGLGRLVWDSKTFEGVGDLGSVSPVTESAEVRAQGISLSLSGVPADFLDQVLNYARNSKTATVWLALFDQRDQLIGDPIATFEGRADVPMIEDEGEVASITITAEGSLVDLERARIRRYTDADHQREYPGDLFFEFATPTARSHNPWNHSGGGGRAVGPYFERPNP